VRRGGGLFGVGVGWRPELAAELLRAPHTVDFVEVVAETCFVQGRARREALAVAELWPVVPHGVKLSLGSAEGIDDDRVDRLARLCRELRSPVITEHVSFVRAGGSEIGHLTQLPRTRAAVRVVAATVARARRRLPDVPLLLENVAWSFRWPDDEMSEADFYGEIVEATGCDLLLDVGNLYANAVNEGRDATAALHGFPLDRVAMLHVAGGVAEDGFYFDTHAHPVPEAVFALAAAVMRVRPRIPVVLERDADFPLFAALEAEVARLRRDGALAGEDPLSSRSAPLAPVEPRVSCAPREGDDAGEATRIAETQAELARLLVATDEPAVRDAPGFDRAALARAREILRRKRIDDALPLLERLAGYGDAIRAIGGRVLASSPRVRRGVAIADAFTIARAAAGDVLLADAARRDLLVLRARFAASRDGTELEPRSLPFIGRQALAGGTTLWATKGPGGQASVRLREGSSRG
jgi:uncharacterized protein (UPF0276 family)